MSLLQIRKLKAPLDLRRGSINTAGTQQTNTAIGNATYTPTDEGVFTCYFNRDIDSTTDYAQPTTAGGVASFDIKISVYDECNHFITTMTLNATQANVQNSNTDGYYICFKITMSDSDFTRLGGCNIYVHVVINNPNATADNHIQFRKDFSNNYHETIKHTHIYDEKEVDIVYWSSQFEIPDVGETMRENITLNEDAFIHVRTKGLWGKTVKLKIYEQRLGDTILASIDTAIGQNRKNVVVSMKYLLACYCNKTKITYNENDPINLYFYIRTECATERTGVDNPEEDSLLPTNPFFKESEYLHLECNMGNQTIPAVNGTVFVQLNEGETRIVELDRYRDFPLGYMCHIEGVGKLANANDNTIKTTPEFTVYPLHTYEIRLSDLVGCGLVTLEEAIYMAPIASAEATLQTSFNKTTQQLSSSSTTNLLINRFLEDDPHQLNGVDYTQRFANSKAIRKLLAQIQHKTEVFASDSSNNNALHYICRDAWQNTTNAQNDRASTRYDKYQECPFGEFFLNYIGANYKLFIGRRYDAHDIQRYSAQNNIRPISPNQINGRDAIAFHQGKAINSTGCLTFNINWDTSAASGNPQKLINNYSIFNDKLYPDQNNVKKLNFVCIDERHAITPTTDKRYHDLIDPSGTTA